MTPRPPPLLAASRAMGMPLIMVVAAMATLQALALMGLIGVDRAVTAWTAGLVERASLQLVPAEDMEAGEQLERALALLAGEEAVASARPLPPEELTRLLAPWLAGAPLPEGLAAPQLIDLELAAAASRPGALAGLEARLEAAIPGAVFDDHGRWKGELASFGLAARALGLAALLLVVLATGGVIVFATYAHLAADRETVDLLHLVGARDQTIAGAFAARFFRLGLLGGLAGALLGALLVALALGIGSGGGEFLPAHGGLLAALAPLAPVPLVSALLAFLTARMTVLMRLARAL